MMGLEVLGEKKKDGVILNSESVDSPEQPENDEGAEQTAQEACISDGITGCDPAAAEPSR